MVISTFEWLPVGEILAEGEGVRKGECHLNRLFLLLFQSACTVSTITGTLWIPDYHS
jgi:hypothetical protein